MLVHRQVQKQSHTKHAISVEVFHTLTIKFLPELPNQQCGTQLLTSKYPLLLVYEWQCFIKSHMCHMAHICMRYMYMYMYMYAMFVYAVDSLQNE